MAKRDAGLFSQAVVIRFLAVVISIAGAAFQACPFMASDST
ncbi:hypothetical protein [Mangrovicoccus sp. HB161399]|nr:hypothetical protein [Mangrovicoccus sp. HB161399]